MDKQDETSVDKLARLRADSDQRRVPSDPDRDTSGDSVYKPEPSQDPVGPDSPTTINGFQTVQVMPLSHYNPEKDLLIINVAVGKMRPDRANQQVKVFKNEMDPWLKDLGWKHVMYVPITYDHPVYRQFRTVNIQRGGAQQSTINDLPGAISDEE